MPTFRLAHLTDPHLQPPADALSRADTFSKRALSAFAWRRKGREHQTQVLKALTDDIAAYGPDHIALTGDLINFAAPAEFEAARAWLQTLGDPRDLTVSPGNHDALVARNAPDRFAPWREWLGDGDAPSFPSLRERGPVAIINLSSAVPTAPWLATGRLGAEQLDALAGLLKSLDGRDLFRLLLIHHPPARGVVSKRKSLEDGAELRALLKTHGVDLVLHGHGHEPAVSRIDGPAGPIPVLGAPSASASLDGHHTPARWHAIEIEGRAIRVSARGLSASGGFEDLGSYNLA